MNISILEDNSFRDTLRLQITNWRRTIKHYPKKTLWWERHVKKRIRQTFQSEGTARNKDRKDLEEFYYAAIYQQYVTPPNNKEPSHHIKTPEGKNNKIVKQTYERCTHGYNGYWCHTK